ncbi:hypothetical protein [Acinetobacter baumannii]
MPVHLPAVLYFLNHLCDEQLPQRRRRVFVIFLNHLCDEQPAPQEHAA